MNSRPIAALLAVSLVAACGGSARQVRRAKSVAYQTEFADVWNVVASEVRGQYPNILVEDAVKGRLITEWRLIERTEGAARPVGERTTSSNVQTGSQAAAAGGSQHVSPGLMAPHDVRPGILFRMFVNVNGGPPWTVIVSGEAAHYEPGMKMLMPYRRGGTDEPEWVQGRIDAMYLRIYRRLERYAIEVKQPQQKVAPLDTSRWAGLPAGAAQSIAEVHRAAAEGEAGPMRPFMPGVFRVGDEESPADTVVAVWSADPGPLAGLARTLEAGCAHDPAEGTVVCPAAEATPPVGRAEFRQAGGVWRFVAYRAAP